MYQELYDENHKLISFNPQNYVNGEKRIKNPSSGEYEGGILCKNCDNNIIGSYETYAAKALFGEKLNTEESPILKNNADKGDNTQFSIFNNVDYRKFKLFLLSILWRASISKRATFGYINLGPHEDILRKMILDGDPGTEHEYPIFTMTYLNDKKMPRDIILTPTRKRTKAGHIFYIFPIGGLIYSYYVNSKYHPLPDYVKIGTISKDNKFIIVNIPKGEAWDFLFNYMGLK
ncbi:hypothetical protein SAMN05216490_2176 [Mucilaginibacter mallensis]|uniref:Uncharacterized protein n=1 Tax=Mucilaginibacter mallensis TaxID=652787 RepID=A0A1H1WHV5_MUCMA|nr:hypothetical protein [Mucilaginibacter mallensis]SDS95846.1 hypothetical protein SAMN05216490_2176 [Mucilaginibacter mallensis]